MKPAPDKHAAPRQTLVLAGEADWSRQAAASLLAGEVLWVGDEAPGGVSRLSGKRARDYLGRECDLLVVDAHGGFDPDAFGAVSGALRGGGQLLLLTPPLDQWPAHKDPDKARYASHPHTAADVGGRFLRRLADALRSHAGVTLIRQGEPVRLPAKEAAAPLPTVADPDCLTRDQAEAVAALLRVARGHRRRPLVLTADRGRGKSAALGIAAARLLAGGAASILLTAPRPTAVAAVFDQAQRLLPAAERRGNRLCLDGRCLSFMAPDELLRALPDTELLLVDEAAAIPVPLLSRLLDHYARIAFASTVHGYEGCGRGFALRFRARLDTVTPQWREQTLETPIRYGPDDPLERLVNHALLLGAEPVSEQVLQDLPVDALVIERVGQDALLADEALLSQLFGLLVQAHYQTRPADLRQLLDAPDLTIWLARDGTAVAAVCLVLAEGGLAPALAEAVAAGSRRPHGHLVPQSLAQYTGRPALANQRTARVMRIAVHPALRRRGLGRRLLRAVAARAAAEGMDWWGASFAADPATLAFWQAAGCGALRLGAARDAASGAHSAILLTPLSAAARQHYPAMRGRFVETLRHGLCDAWRQLEPAVAARLLVQAPRQPLLQAQDRADIAAFAAGRRDLAAARLALWRLACDAFAAGVDMPSDDRLLLVRRILQVQGDAEVVAELGLAGRKALLGQLQALAASVLERLS
jgi:tRNA(Met) cytidine acetyltransferase